MGTLRISKEYGVNPTVRVCFYCEQAIDVLLLGQLPEDKEAPRHVCTSVKPCDTCKQSFIDTDVIVFVEALEEEDKEPTGRYVLLSREAVQTMQNERNTQYRCSDSCIG